MQKMKILTIVCFVFLLNTGSLQLSAQKTKHVILISLDGSRPEFYMDTIWPAPTLQSLKNTGAFASKGIKSVFPSITWPAHTSIITGGDPITHGVYYNKPFEMPSGYNYSYYSYIKSKTLFDAINEAGMTSGAVWWPVLVGSPVDYIFPVRRPGKDEVGNQLSITKPYIRPDDLLSQVEKEIGRDFTLNDLSFKNNAQGRFVVDITKYIIKEHKPNFLAVHLGEIDHAEHGHGINSLEVRAAIEFNDSLVSEIIDAVKSAGIMDSSVIIITGDHGHSDVQAVFQPNVYLYKEGLISDNCSQAVFYAAGGSAFLHLGNENDTATLKEVIRILKNTSEYKRNVFKILNRHELRKKGGDPNAALAITMAEGYQVKGEKQGEPLVILSPPFYSTHGFDPDLQSMNTMFLAVGGGVEHVDVTDMKLVDLAPFIAKLLGLDFDAPDGKYIPGIISEK